MGSAEQHTYVLAFVRRSDGNAIRKEFLYGDMWQWDARRDAGSRDVNDMGNAKDTDMVMQNVRLTLVFRRLSTQNVNGD